MNVEISNKLKYYHWIFTVVVVCGHANAIPINTKFINEYDESILNYFCKFWSYSTNIAMTFFFFMSGFWFYYNVTNMSDVLLKMKKRINTILLPYLLWSAVDILYLRFFNIDIGINFEIGSILNHLFFNPVIGPLWYLLALLMLQLFAPVIVIIKNKVASIITLLSGVFIFTIIGANIVPLENWWWFDSLIKYCPAYFLGVFFSLHFSQYILNREYDSKFFTFLGILMFVFIKIIKVNIFIVPMMLIILGSWFILKPSLFKKVPIYFNCSFYLYALHLPFYIPITHKILLRLFSDPVMSGIENVLYRLLHLFLVILFAYVSRIVCKYIFSPTVFKWLSGGRGV